eukprot:GCRY01007017.1.p1 GENE.GCRY01007017.1~~GCRY01007017.1.p1  ORF type:complete len:354 (+),score=51.08 GCRY01007017.1:69-1064(+)
MSLNKRGPQRSSAVYDYFIHQPVDDNMKCLICQRSFRPVVTNMVLHLKVHPGAYAEFQEKERKKHQKPNNQQTVTEMFSQVQKSQPMDDVCHGVADCALSFHIFEQETFKNMVLSLATLHKNNQWPSRKVVGRKMISLKKQIFENCISKINSSIVTVGGDGWSNNRENGVTNLIAMTAQFSFFLESVEDDQKHDADYYVSCFSTQIDLLLQKGALVVAICTDNAEVMTKTKTILQEQYPWLVPLSCLSHSIQLVINDVLKIDPYKGALETLSRVFKEFRQKDKRRKLREVQQLDNVEPKKMLKYCATRWNSKLTCLERLLLLWDYVKNPLV